MQGAGEQAGTNHGPTGRRRENRYQSPQKSRDLAAELHQAGLVSPADDPKFLTEGKQIGPREKISCHLCNRGRGRHAAEPLAGAICVARSAPVSMFTFEATAITRLSSSIVGMGQRILSFSDNPDH